MDAEKLGVLRMKAEKDNKKNQTHNVLAILQDKGCSVSGDGEILQKPVENGVAAGDKAKDNKPLTDSNTGTLRRLSKIADNQM